jgi:hypothetical protein
MSGLNDAPQLWLLILLAVAVAAWTLLEWP